MSTKQIAEVSPRLKARIAGFCYVLIFIAAPSGAASATPTKMLITLACDTAVALLFYDLLKPVSRRLSLVAAVFRLIFVVVMATNSLNYFGPLVLLKSQHSPSGFNRGYLAALVFFAFHVLLIGYLIFKSGFLPRIIGMLLMIECFTMLFNSLTDLFVPTFSPPTLQSIILGSWVLAEGSLTLWLLVKGVNLARWNDRARATGSLLGNC